MSSCSTEMPGDHVGLPVHPSAAARLSGEHIVCISSIDWGAGWQSHQELMSRLARQGNRILFIENTGVRSPGVRDVTRLGLRLRNKLSSPGGFREERPGVTVYAPIAVPLPYSPTARLANRALVIRPVRRWLKRAGWPRPIVWTFLPTLLARDLIRAIAPALTIYYCVDALPASSPEAHRLEASETELLRACDLAFVTGDLLREHARRVRDDVHVFPAGVDYPLFEQARRADVECPADLRNIPSPRAGFVGGVNGRVDQALLCDVATRLPSVSFVLLGPIEGSVDALTRCPNVHLIGQRPHAELPSYMHAFDAGMIPYRLTPFTAHIYPAKLNEYLAMGLPVVSTELPEIHRFNARHGALIQTADGADTFAQALRAAIADRSPVRAAARAQVARHNDWGVRLDGMSALIVRALAQRHAQHADAPCANR